MVKKRVCHAPDHPFPRFIGVDDNDVHLHLLYEHREEVTNDSGEDGFITFIECYVEEIECKKN